MDEVMGYGELIRFGRGGIDVCGQCVANLAGNMIAIGTGRDGRDGLGHAKD